MNKIAFVNAHLVDPEQKLNKKGSTLSNLPTSQWVDIDVGLGFTSIYNAGGNVGIATTDPRHGLQIGGQVNATPQQAFGRKSSRRAQYHRLGPFTQ